MQRPSRARHGREGVRVLAPSFRDTGHARLDLHVSAAMAQVVELVMR